MKSFRLSKEPMDENLPAGKGCVILFLTASILILAMLFYAKCIA